MKDREMTSQPGTAPRRTAALALVAMCAGLAVTPGSAPAAGSPATQLAESVSAAPAGVTRALGRHALRLLDGTDASLTSASGQVVVLNFWATWCKPCLRELPALEKLNADIAPRGGRVLAISIDDDRRNVARFIGAHHVALPVAHDGPSGLARELDLKAVPLTIVLDRSGEIAWVSSRTDEAGLAETRAAVERLLSRPASPPAVASEGAEGSR